MRRRDFLVGTLASVAYVACSPDGPGAGPGPVPMEAPVPPTSTQAESDQTFPQGLASGDPRPDRVILWTRVEPAAVGGNPGDPIQIEYIVAKDEALSQIVARGRLPAEPTVDHTIRLAPTGLEPGRTYYYRFEAAGRTTRVGRTRTAPAPDDARPVTFAFASCQDYVGRYYHAWRALLEQSLDLDFVLFLGDYVYETVNDARFQSPAADRKIVLPDGLDLSDKQDKSRIAAGTLADYRTLYKTVRADAHLKEVHRLYPFVMVWDDHEFANDCWQDHVTDFSEKDPRTGAFTDEQSTPRKLAANRAWAEYQPADVVWKQDATFPNDLQIYRGLRYGKHVDLVITDQRTYRADHLIPEGPRWLAMGKFTENSPVGSRLIVRKSSFDAEERTKKPTMLGAAQKAWFVDQMKRAQATWKVWANGVVLFQQVVNLGTFDGIPDLIKTQVYVGTDQWDGYRSERQEILTALRTAGVTNLLVCTGDVHAFYAAEIFEDFDAPTKRIAVEYVTGAITSSPFKDSISSAVGESALLRPIAAALGAGLDNALRTTNGNHLRYADSGANGFAVLRLDGAQAEATFYAVSVVKDRQYFGVTGTQRFVTPVGTNQVRRL